MLLNCVNIQRSSKRIYTMMANNFDSTAFVEDSKTEWENVAPGTKRKVMAYNANVMQVKVAFEKGAIGSLHQHYHTQISYVSKGMFEVEINGKKKILQTGDVFYVAPNLVHGVVCLEAGELVDVFSPYREDFI